MNDGRFLLVATRDSADAAHAEYLDFLESSGLSESQLSHCRITSASDVLPDLGGFDGIFVGGSPFNITDWEHCEVQKHAHRLMFEVLNSATPSFFTCFGASFTAFSLGGLVDRVHGEVAGTSKVQLTEAAAADPIASRLSSKFLALTGHKESVAKLPDDAVLLATGPTCPVQMYRVRSNNWVTQFHPEMNAEGLLRRMSFYVNDGYFAESEFEEIARTVRRADLSVSESIVPAFVEYCLQSSSHRYAS